MNAAATLRTQQRRLQQAITADSADAPGLRTRSGDRPPLLQVYRHAYRARLVAALADNHPVLQRALGDEAFAALGQAYVDACPSTRRSIRWYGDGLAAFMAGRPDLAPHPALADIARMDWALRGAFDAADAPALDPASLAAVPPDAWGGLRFVPHPSVRLLRLQWAIEPAWRSLPPAEAPLLAVAMQGAPFAALCEQAAQAHEGNAAQAAATAAGALQQWLHEGLFTAALR